MLTAILLLIVFLVGFYIGAENPSVLAQAQAELHKAQAAATIADTKLKKQLNGLE